MRWIESIWILSRIIIYGLLSAPENRSTGLLGGTAIYVGKLKREPFSVFNEAKGTGKKAEIVTIGSRH